MPNSSGPQGLGPIPSVSGCSAYNPNFGTQYNYLPSLAAGIVFCLLFGASMVAHIVQAHRKRTWWTMVFAVGALTEVLGWAGRTWSAQCPYNYNAFLMQICTLIIAPTFFTAGIYIILGRLIKLMGPHTSPITAKTYLWIFCTCDFISLVVQAVGGALASTGVTDSSGQKSSKLGTNIMVGGIDFQMASITVFVGFFVDFLRRVNRDSEPLPPRVKILIAATAASCALIYVRSIYRTVELLQGWNGYLISHEGYFVGFDAVTMFVAVAVFNVIHPGWYLPRTDKAMEPSVENPREGIEEKR